MTKQLSEHLHPQSEYVSHFYGLAGFIMFTSEIWKQWTLICTSGDGHYILWYLPFQLCSIPMYICMVHGLLALLAGHSASPLRIKKYIGICSLLQSFLMDFGLLGGTFAFFDTSGMHYDALPLTVHSYVWHIALIILGCFGGLDCRTNHSRRGLYCSIGIYLICCGIATALNLLLYPYGTINMFYISPRYPMQQKVFREIAQILGNGWGIGIYIFMSVAGAGLLHLGWYALNRRIRKISLDSHIDSMV